MSIASFLEAMSKPEGYDGPQLQVMQRNLKQEDVPTFVSRVLAELPTEVQKVANFQKDRMDGDLSQKVFDGLNERHVTLVDLSEFF